MARVVTTVTHCDLCGCETKPGGGIAPDANCHIELGGIGRDACLACVRVLLDQVLGEPTPDWLARRAVAVDTIAVALAAGHEPLTALDRDELAKRAAERATPEAQAAEEAERAMIGVLARETRERMGL